MADDPPQVPEARDEPGRSITNHISVPLPRIFPSFLIEQSESRPRITSMLLERNFASKSAAQDRKTNAEQVSTSYSKEVQ